MSSDNKMKGLLKGLRFISQIFDNEKQQEIEIGHPTDVKHVAHIGWDGPSENAPGWMSEFKSVPGISSAPQNMSGDMHCQGSDNDDPVPVKGVSSADTTRRGGSRSSVEDIPSKPSKRQTNSTGNTRECHAKEKSDRPRQSKKSSSKQQQPPNDSFKGSKTTDQQPPNDNSLQLQGNNNNNNDLPPRNLPADKTKRTYSKKTRDSHGVGSSGSSKSRSKPQPKDKDPNTNEEQQHTRSSSKTRNKHRHSQEDDGQVLIDRGSNQDVLQSYTN